MKTLEAIAKLLDDRKRAIALALGAIAATSVEYGHILGPTVERWLFFGAAVMAALGYAHAVKKGRARKAKV